MYHFCDQNDAYLYLRVYSTSVSFATRLACVLCQPCNIELYDSISSILLKFDKLPHSGKYITPVAYRLLAPLRLPSLLQIIQRILFRSSVTLCYYIRGLRLEPCCVTVLLCITATAKVCYAVSSS